MDAPTIAALAIAVIAVISLAAPVYLRLGRLEAEVKAGRERADAQHAESRERTDAQHAESRERADVQHTESRERAESRENAPTPNNRRIARERADARHTETLAEIRRLADAFGSHSHAPDGGIIFRIPPQGGLPRPE